MSDPVPVVAAAWRRLPVAFAVEAARQDQDARFARGERPTAEEYLNALPRVAASAEDALVLIYGEVMHRSARGEVCRADEYASRFPHLAARLADLLAVHAALATRVGSAASIAIPRAAAEPPALPGYTAVRFAGRGGMGDVFRAAPVAGGPAVAIKVLSRTAASSIGTLRFLQEAEILARLQHPNVVRYVSAGVWADRPYLISEWAAGGTLADRILGKPQPWRWAVRVLAAVCRGVEAAHAIGVIHRDLKPANIFLTDADEPLVGDFGVARLLQCDGLASGTGEVLGTPQYMPPEQVEGDHRCVGPAADVYALGGILYELLTGRPPFIGPTDAEVVRQVLRDPPTFPDPPPPIPSGLALACLRCLQKDPHQRFETVEDYRTRLERHAG